jgi:hypothetical protein
MKLYVGVAKAPLCNLIELSSYVECVAELMLNKFNRLYGTKIELVKHRYKENIRRTKTECYPVVLDRR